MQTNVAKLLTNRDLKDFAGSFVSMRVNGIEAEKGFEEIIEELNQTSNVSGLSIAEFNAQSEIEKYNYNTKQSAEEIAANFRFKYRNSADGVELVLNSLDGRNNDQVVGMLETIDKSFVDLAAIENKASVMNQRQCVEN